VGGRTDTYEQLARVRLFELSQAGLWHRGLISGEFHSSVGEEAVDVGVVRHLRKGDAMALDHRGSGPLVARGVEPLSLLHEVLGRDQGVCGGSGGHMHLFEPGVLAASDGIVGSSGPTACGFAMAGRRLRPGSVAVAFFGEGAVNAGMMLESWNLAAVWRLPVLFVCKDNGWSITTRSRNVTSGGVADRARTFGLETRAVNGWDVDAVSAAAGDLVERSRGGRGPGFLLARVHRPDGHFLGDAMLRVLNEPIGEARALLPGLVSAAVEPLGTSRGERARAALNLSARFGRLAWERAVYRRDPVARYRRRIDAAAAREIDTRTSAEMRSYLDQVCQVTASGGTQESTWQ
jgi:acetoin:2,6-dichlorophenolindophenol oxidoreductase subunit alpha